MRFLPHETHGIAHLPGGSAGAALVQLYYSQAPAKATARVLELAGRQDRVSAFLIQRCQPHKGILQAAEIARVLPAGFRTLRPAATHLPTEQLRVARRELDRLETEIRQESMRAIKAEIEPEQDIIEGLLNGGATHIQRFTALNMMSAEIPSSALSTISFCETTFPTEASLICRVS